MMIRTLKYSFLAVVTLVLSISASYAGSWQKEFGIDKCHLMTTGQNKYFVLEPGYQLVYEGEDTKMQITVLDEVKTVAGINARVVEEREWKNGELHEVARNFFAICEQTKDVYYFGEEVDYYDKGKVVNHAGSWEAGKGDNKPGLMMPAQPVVGMKFYQEIAPTIAMDRAKVVSVSETCKMPAGTFTECLKVEESNAVTFWSSFKTEYKMHAPGIGLVQDEDLVLVKYGKINVATSEPTE